MIPVELCKGEALVGLRPPPAGARVPNATSAMGCAYLAALPKVERDELVSELAAAQADDWARIKRGIQHALAD